MAGRKDPPKPDDPIGLPRVGDFELLRELGRGGMGRVYEARQISLNRPVALKFMTESAYNNPQFRARFLREAQTAAALNHPGICTIHEIGEVPRGTRSIEGSDHEIPDGTPFIAMELIDGESLDRVLAESGPLPLRRLLALAVQVAEGLAAAHATRIVHRDLKPSNLMVLPDDRVKILDFGLAKPLGPADEGLSAATTLSAELTGQGRILGTVSYMSPEQTLGNPVDSRSDLFSFGILLFEMATGRRPFQGESSTSTLAKILEAKPPSLNELRPDLPRELLGIIERCLQKDPADRFGDTRDLVGALKQLVQESVSGAPIGAGTRGTSELRPTRASWRWGRVFLVMVIAALSVVAINQFRTGRFLRQDVATGMTSDGDIMIAVLPLENLGSEEDEFFAIGITEEITNRLVAVDGLGVISQSSAFRYAGTTKTTREIGEELGVAYLIQGSVRWAHRVEGSSRVRIAPKLVRVSDDTQLWGKTYDSVIDDIFEVQSEIARKTVDRLGVVLAEPEPEDAASRVTDNIEAYEAYLRGLYHLEHGQGREAAISSLEKAVQRDPDFALAHAMLAETHSWICFLGIDTSQERRTRRKRALDRAVELAPDGPETHRVLGVYHYHQREYGRALEELEIALRRLPSNALLLLYKGYVLRRLGRWEEALAAFERGSRLNPLEAAFQGIMGESLVRLREYPRALQYYEKAADLIPDEPAYRWRKARLLLTMAGDIAAARESLEAIPPESIVAGVHTDQLAREFYRLQMYSGDYRAAIETMAAHPSSWLRINIVTRPIPLLVARAHEELMEHDLAQEAYETARTMLEAEILESPDDARLHVSLGLVLAGLGRRKDAIRAAQHGVDLLPVSKDPLIGPYMVTDLARVLARVGDHDAAIDQLEFVMSVPAELSVHLLELDPDWEPIRDHPRFRGLLRDHGL